MYYILSCSFHVLSYWKWFQCGNTILAQISYWVLHAHIRLYDGLYLWRLLSIDLLKLFLGLKEFDHDLMEWPTDDLSWPVSGSLYPDGWVGCPGWNWMLMGIPNPATHLLRGIARLDTLVRQTEINTARERQQFTYSVCVLRMGVQGDNSCCSWVFIRFWLLFLFKIFFGGRGEASSYLGFVKFLCVWNAKLKLPAKWLRNRCPRKVFCKFLLL